MTNRPKQHKAKAARVSPSHSIPVSGTSRSNSELVDLAYAERLADYHDDRMYERILTGIMRQCRKGAYHPKTITSVKNIMHTKMLDYPCSPSRREIEMDEDWFIGVESDSDHTQLFGEQVLTRHKIGLSWMHSSAAYDSGRLHRLISAPPVRVERDLKSQPSHVVERGIFELDL